MGFNPCSVGLSPETTHGPQEHPAPVEVSILVLLDYPLRLDESDADDTVIHVFQSLFCWIIP